MTSWLDDRTPEARWRLLEVAIEDAAGGRSLRLGDLAVLPIDDVTAVLDCTSGWYSNQEWRGVRLDRLVEPGTARAWSPGRPRGTPDASRCPTWIRCGW